MSSEPSSPARGRRRRTWLAIVGLVLVVAGLPIALLMWWIALRGAGSYSATEWVGTGIAVALLSLPLGIGCLLVWLGDPGLVRRGAHRLRNLGASALRPASLRAAMGTSFGLALAFALLSAPAMLLAELVAEGLSGLVAFAAVCAFSVIDPILNVRRRSWWLGALLSVVAWVLLFGVVCATAEAIHHIGEGGMVFLLPMMGYPAMLGISGLVKVAMWLSPSTPSGTS